MSENKGIYINPNKLQSHHKNMNILYLFTNKSSCKSNINLWKFIDDLEGTNEHGRYPMTISSAVNKLPFIHLAKSDKLKGDVKSKGITAFPYMFLGNESQYPKNMAKHKVIQKCSGYRLKRSGEHQNYWILEQNERDNKVNWEALPQKDQTWEHLNDIINERLENPILDYAKTADKELVFVVDITNAKIGRDTLADYPPDTVIIGDIVTLSLGTTAYTARNPVTKTVSAWPQDPSTRADIEIPTNSRLWVKGALYTDTDEVYFKAGTPKEITDKIAALDAQLVIDLAAAPNAAERTRLNNEHVTRRDDLLRDAPANGFYLWTGAAQHGGGSRRKSIRKHRGIHQTGGKAGKLKKGYKYSGKTLKNGKPQIIKVKRN